ncbi:MAG: RNA-binding transcriptional accessory protein, partial [Myxococcales bacterium]|nr:RNA-binding transcriptional accessory protein [Myxococcales bacterium]
MTTTSELPDFDPVPTIARDLELPLRGVSAVVKLLAEGATVPFIARYRKEVTGGLDEVQIRAIEERRGQVLELEQRRRAVLKSIEEQGKLTPELKAKIDACETRVALEDLYLPYKPRRRTRATRARERGLEPLAEQIASQSASGDPDQAAAAFVNDSSDEELAVPDIKAALAGARDILAERVAENADIRAAVRAAFDEQGVVRSQVAPGLEGTPSKFEQYFDYEESIKTIPSHRYLAVRRGEQDGALRLRLALEPEQILPRVEAMSGLVPSSPWAPQLARAIKESFTRLLGPSIETDLRVELKMRADREAVEVFAENLKSVLMAAPLGGKAVVGIDPGLRTGCKCVAVDVTGKFQGHSTIFLHGAGKQERARAELTALLERHRPAVIAVGNGTGGRETEAFVRETLRALAGEGGARQQLVADVAVVSVNEAGASVYSASTLAREEFPELDVTIRGAISIARRLQDPLAELVKIEPKSIGVGQYQHDVYQRLLERKLDQVVESCVNQVGVDLNTASAPLLARVAGVSRRLARSIVEHREREGAFAGRAALREVTGLGPRTFEQAAGFLRVRGGAHPLDASAVHPERYPLVERIAADMEVSLDALVGDAALASAIPITRYLDEGVGEPTLRDIIDELSKPGRDPRDTFDPPRFRDDIHALEDLEPGMSLEGVVTNVTAFGAFVDIGVHQDGLVHISELSERFVKNPHDVVRTGDKLRVRVLSVDLERKRIALSARPPRERHG